MLFPSDESELMLHLLSYQFGDSLGERVSNWVNPERDCGCASVANRLLWAQGLVAGRSRV